MSPWLRGKIGGRCKCGMYGLCWAVKECCCPWDRNILLQPAVPSAVVASRLPAGRLNWGLACNAAA